MALGTDMNTLNDDEFRSYSATTGLQQVTTMVNAPSTGQGMSTSMPARGVDTGKSGGFSR